MYEIEKKSLTNIFITFFWLKATGLVDPVCVSIRPSFLFIDVSVIGLSETRYHTIVKICRQSDEFTGVDFSRVKASVTARLIPMN